MAMRLGTDTGSMMNHLASRSTRGAPTPEVGMGATVLMWTDRHAATVTEVFKHGKYTYVGVKRDNTKVVSGNLMDGSAEYEYETNMDNNTDYYRMVGEGEYVRVMKNPETGRFNKIGGSNLVVGYRSEHRDPHF